MAFEEVLGLDITQGAGSWRYANEGAERSTPTGLISIDDVSLSASDTRYWYGALRRSDGSVRLLNMLLEPFTLEELELRAGDNLSFVYIGDRDRDALSDSQERELGTNPELSDTDGDTLSDALEVYGSDLSAPPCSIAGGVRVISNPLLADSDGDGSDDATELASCENPSFLVTADAGQSLFVNAGSAVSLNGAAGGLFTGQPEYTWRLLQGPDLIVDGQAVRTLDGIAPSFNASNEISTLIFELQVSVDGICANDQVTVQVRRDRNSARYVSFNPAGSGDGTLNSPYATLEEEISAAPGEDFYVMTQRTDGEVVPYSLVNPLRVPTGTNLYGGYDADWVRDVQTNPTLVELASSTPDLEGVFHFGELDVTSTTQLSGFILEIRAADATGDKDLVALSATGSGVDTLEVSDVTLNAGSVTGSAALPGSSYAARVVALARFELRDSRLISGNGGAGAAGASGSAGQNGGSGAAARSGVDGIGRGGVGGAGTNGGAGGRGGVGPAGSGGFGVRGATTDSTGTAGGPGRGGATAGGIGRDGQNGGNGGPGANGIGGLPGGSALPSEGKFVPFAGLAGNRAKHGGGAGGGGGGAFFFGNGGAAGGGEGGEGGNGGAGGGSSIGLWLESVPNVSIRNNTIAAGSGGNGGNGGAGGSGGSGGRGGAGAAGDLSGGQGGNGGSGGAGGIGDEGNGGSGGPSIAVFVGAGLEPIIADNVLNSGAGGSGGDNGAGGNGGESVVVYDADPDSSRPVLRGNSTTAGQQGAQGAR